MKNLTSRCKSSTNENVRERGEDDARAGRVRFLRADPQQPFLTAIVRGSDKVYQTRIDWQEASDDILIVDCPCPYAADHTVCKHVWATLVEMDRFSFDLRVPGSGPLSLRPAKAEAEEPTVTYSFPFPFAHPDSATSRRQARPVAPPALRSAPAPSPPEESPWRRHLNQIRKQISAPAARPGERAEPEVWLLLDRKVALQPSGALRVDFLQRQRLKDGREGRLKAYGVRRGGTFETPATVRPALELLLELIPVETWRYSPYSSASNLTSALLPARLAPLLVPRLCATGRFGWREEDRTIPITWDDGPPWRLALVGEEEGEEAGEEAGRLLLSGRLEREGEVADLADADLILRSGLVVFHDRAARLDAEATFPWLSTLRREGALEIPAREAAAVALELLSDPRTPPLRLPERLAPAIEEVAGTPSIALAFISGGAFGHLRFVYPGEVVLLGDPRPILSGLGPGRLIRRDRAAEERARDLLRSDGWIVEPSGEVLIRDTALSAAIAAIEERGWRIELEGRRLRRSGGSALRVASGVDWFDLSGDFDFGGVSVRLPALLRALRDRERFVELADGTLGMVPGDWAERYGALAELAPGEGEGQALRFGAHQALVLDALLAAEPGVAIDEVFARTRERLRSFDRLEPMPAPAGFTGSLRPYQEIGLAWFQLLAELGLGGCLADDMGLGKTVQLLAHLAERKRSGASAGRPSLLVVPKSVVPHWTAEAARFTPELAVGVFHGAERRTLADEIDRYDVLVTTYATMRLDLPLLRDREFDVLALDEAQAIKNASSLTAKACRLLRARHRLALTGTPIENHLGELWSLFEFLNPGLLGQLPSLAEHAGKSRLPPEALATVAKALQPLMLRRTKEEVLEELPPKTEQTLLCDLSAKERKRYDQLRDHYRNVLLGKVAETGLGRAKVMVLEALLRLRQAACHAGLIDPKRKKEPSAKLELLLEQIQEIVEGGHKALVFSQFTKFLAIVRDRLDRLKIPYEYLDGQTTDRQARVDRFQTEPAIPLFLISLKAGGLGLNLTAASYVFLLDPWWNPAVETQAIDRTHRIGQTQPVFAYRLIARDTVEEKILDLQAEKRALADAIVAGDQRILKQLTVEDLERLLG